MAGTDRPSSGDDSHLIERKVSGEEILKGHFLHAFRDTVKLPDDTQATREYVVHPGAVMIIPMLDDGRLVIERQFRYPIGEVMIEFPAGKIDAGEDRLVCAKRELLEETGYVAAEWARACLFHPVIAYSTELIEIWFARGLTLTSRQLDEGEFLEVTTTTFEELMAWVRDGKVTDSKTLIGTMWLQNVLAGRWKLDWRS